MIEEMKYTLWVKCGSTPYNTDSASKAVRDHEGIDDVHILPLDASALSRKEAIMAVTLSVTANFATDGINKIIELLTQDSDAEVVYCRRPDGEEMNIKELKQQETK